MSITSELEPYLVSDEIMAAAYAGTSLQRRAWMKKQTAHLCSHYGLDPAQHFQRLVYQDSALSGTSISRPVEFVGLVIDSNAAAWNKILALMVPAAVYAGSGTAVFIPDKDQSELPPDLLTALELAGIENIFCLSLDDLTEWKNSLDDKLECIFFSVTKENHSPEQNYLFLGKQHWLHLSPVHFSRAAVWVGKEEHWDWEAMIWANPEVSFIAAGTNSVLAPGAVQVLDMDLSDFLKQDMDVYYGPEEYFRHTMACLGLSPGMEACWVWPGLDSRFFLSRRQFWSSSPLNR